MTLVEKILSRCKPDGECLRYWGYILSNGYGQTRYKYKLYLVHRAILENKLGRPIGAGLEACHTRDCKHKNCVNDHHLYEGSRLNNVGDYVASITHCPKGHEYDKDNTIFYKNGSRRCRICKNAQLRAYRKRLHE